jgi:hypothetical protein
MLSQSSPSYNPSPSGGKSVALAVASISVKKRIFDALRSLG